jgi:prepilin-type N-terminal cleavage/methylation domain-containing protein
MRIKTLKPQHGFTVIEMLVILVIIGILLSLLFVTHAGIAQKERNTERQRDIGELRDEIESYYAQNNKYPTLSELNSNQWRSTNMKGADREILRDPSNKSYSLAAKPVAKMYAYAVTSPSGTPCDNQETDCIQYTLTATLEGGGTFVKNNLN